jgi:hypothetical protein
VGRYSGRQGEARQRRGGANPGGKDGKTIRGHSNS